MQNIGPDFQTITLYGGEPLAFDLVLRRNDEANTPEINLANRKLDFVIYSDTDQTFNYIATLGTYDSASSSFSWRLAGTVTRPLEGRSDLKFAVVERLNDGDDVIRLGIIMIAKGPPGYVDYDAGATFPVIVRVTRINDLDAGPKFQIQKVENTVAGAGPANTSLPSITGTAKVAQTLTASTGAWTNSPTSYGYQWRRGGVAISGATSATYLLVSADSGATISVQVTATNAQGASQATSAPVTIAVQPVLQNLTLTSTTLLEHSPSGTLVGSIVGKTSGSTVALFYDVGSRFNLSANTVTAGATPCDFATQTSHILVLRESHPDATAPGYRDSNITIIVTDDPSYAPWILTTGAWNDAGEWRDDQVWADAA